MAKGKYQADVAYLEGRGLHTEKTVEKFFGFHYEGYYPFGEKRCDLQIDYRPFSKTATLEMRFPYGKRDADLEAAYDTAFPEEKGMWGRSSPSFEQAIIDYNRGQSEGSPLRIRLTQGGTRVEISITIATLKGGAEGFHQAIGRFYFELRQGQLHRDVLIHLFA